MIKKIIQLKLKILAKLILARQRPEIIGVTGSVGKTSAKEAIFAVLTTKFRVRRNIKNYNNEIGLPLTVIGVDSPGRSLIGWARVFFKAFRLVMAADNNYPEILILELGVDRPGDMDYLNRIIRPKIGVITAVAPAHLEYFGSLDKIAKEKAKLIKNLDKSGRAILNYDDAMVRSIISGGKAVILSYGLDPKADLRAQEVVFSFASAGAVSAGHHEARLLGVSFKLSYHGSAVPVLLPNLIGQAAVYAALAAAAVGISYGLNLIAISQALYLFKPPAGRMNLIKGVKDSLIVDDSYNSSPQSCLAALRTVSEIPLITGARKLAVLGDMLELGSLSQEAHLEIGRQLQRLGVDKLITVGERSRDIARGARSAGLLKDNIFHFARAEEAGRFLEQRIGRGDLILVKGSQAMRMEKIVKEIMAEPLRAKELLTRQEEEWLRKVKS